MSLLKYILIAALAVYRWVVSPAKIFVFGPQGRCRFTPSCSTYAIQALEIHGVARGSWLAFSRVCRCHPWGGCGPDPVPREANQVSGVNVDAAPTLASWSRVTPRKNPQPS